MNIVGYGGGTNSTAMLIGLYHRKIPVDLFLFSNTGDESMGTNYGVVKTQLNGRNWTSWLKIAYCDVIIDKL